jgi:hypothetical protein
VYRGLGRVKGHRRREIEMAAELTFGGRQTQSLVLQGSRSIVETPWSFTASMQSLCAATVGLGCGGVAWHRRRRELCVAELRGMVC